MHQLQTFFNIYKKQIVMLVVLLPLMFLGVFLALNPTVFRPKASGASLTLDPTNVVKKENEPFVVSVILDPAGKKILGADIEVKYDPSVLDISAGDIVTFGFGSTTVKSVNPTTGIIKLAFASFNKPTNNLSDLFSTTTTIATLPFTPKLSGSTSILIGKSTVVDTSGKNILENAFSQVSVEISSSQDVSATKNKAPLATYSFTPTTPLPGSTFTVKVQSKTGAVENPALMVNATAYKVTKSGNNTYSASVTGLQVGKHILQLVGGCVNSTTTPNCDDAEIGFNPYQLNLVNPSATSQPAQSVSGNNANVTLQDVVNNWGKSGFGDVNNDGVVDSLDFAIVYAQPK